MNSTRSLFTLLISSALLIVTCLTASAQSKSELDAHKRKWDTPAWTDTIHNPMARFTWAADSGKVMYNRICNVCHGNSGKGDGVAASGLTIRPADHTSALVQSQSDGSLFYEMSNGHAPMPAYKTILSEKQRWELVCYIRTFKPKAKK